MNFIACEQLHSIKCMHRSTIETEKIEQFAQDEYGLHWLRCDYTMKIEKVKQQQQVLFLNCFLYLLSILKC